jgi:diguanylate cyclase (GGDEF)-like protein/PAS domain S-box-containing protein
MNMKNVDEVSNKLFLLTQQNLIINQHVFITTSDLEGKIIDISQAYLDFTGYKREDVIGKNHRIFRNHNMDQDIIRHLWESLKEQKTWRGELKNNKASGEEYWINTIISPLYDKNNDIIGYISIKEDITSKKRLEELSTIDSLTLLHNRRYFDTYFKRELKRSSWKNETFALLLISVDDYEYYRNVYGRLNADTVILQISNAMKMSIDSSIHELFKVTETEFALILLNCNDTYISEISHKLLHSVEVLQIKNSESNTSDDFTVSIGVANIDTNKYNYYCDDIYNIADANLSAAKKNGGNNVITEINSNQAHKLKNIDIITKLPNRGALVHDISILHDEAMLIILHIKQINSLKNLYGFRFTTEIVTTKANQLLETLRDEEASLYSLNLQEFAILITNKNLFDKYFLILKHFILMNNDYFINDLEQAIPADFTAGIAYGNDSIFNHADLVLQEAILSKLSYKIYQNNPTATQLQEDTINRLIVYKNALHEGKIIPYFQPIVDSHTSKVIKYEALARLETEDREIISPYYFLDSAKEDKSFEYFTRQMMQKVFNVFAKNDIEISMNLSYENITSETMVDYIKNRLEKYGGKGITFEIVESEDIQNYKVLEEFILLVKSYGCKVSIDDFGSGYSNFTQILQLNIDYIKLDGSLIEKLNSDINVKHMIKGLLEYAQNANIQTIAEFVSSRELAESVRELGIDYMQGYYYGEPKPQDYYGMK